MDFVNTNYLRWTNSISSLVLYDMIYKYIIGILVIFIICFHLLLFRISFMIMLMKRALRVPGDP
jgi:hypothetical protein